jgi:hypothetical protein
MDDEKVKSIGQWVAAVVVISVGVLMVTVIVGLTVQTVRWLF